MTRAREQGSALLVVMATVVALLTGAVALTTVLVGSTNSAGITKTTLSGLYCAEAGLTAARALVVANAGAWDPDLGTNVEPSYLAVVNHDIDGDGHPDFKITLRDNDDETSGANDLAHDVDGLVFVVATCTIHPETPTQVTELVTSAGKRKLWIRTD